MKKLMIYGATGYTGRMIVQHALDAGLQILIAGRDPNKLAGMASELKVPLRVFSLDSPDAIDDALDNIGAVINCAGPFLHTARPLMEAAIRVKVHYLDVAAELDSYQLAEVYDPAADSAGVMLLPGCGGSVAMLGCLAIHAATRMKKPVRISLAMNVTGTMSRGSVISATENLSTQILIRRNSQLQQAESTGLQDFDFGMGPQPCFPLTLPDVITVWKATGIPDIATFVHVGVNGFPQDDLANMPDGPSAREREASRYQAAANVLDENGKSLCMLLDTVNGYSFTALAAAEAGRRVLAGEWKPGFQTPAALFGKHFAEALADTLVTVISDLN